MLWRWLLLALCVVGAAMAADEGSGEKEEAAVAAAATSDDDGDEEAESAPVSTFAGRCYQCNSKLDDDCADTDALLENGDRYLRDCAPLTTANGMLRDAPAIGCRKALQIVESVDEGEERILRECAYGGQNVHAQKKSGNKGIRIYYYQCDNEDGCNGANGRTAVLGALLAPIVALALLRR